MTSQKALEHRLTDLMARAERTFVHNGAVVLPKVITTTIEDAWTALCLKRDLERVDRLLAVIEFLIVLQSRKFELDRKGWLARQQELAA